MSSVSPSLRRNGVQERKRKEKRGMKEEEKLQKDQE